MKKHLLSIILIAISAATWLVCFPSLPEQVPVHWGADGADGYQPKAMAFFTLHALMIGIYLFMTAIPKIDPKKKNYKYFSKAYYVTNLSIVILFFIINMLILLTSLGYDIPMKSLAVLLVGLLFLVIGNYMQQAKQNFFFGIRTPWALMDETNWRKTHRLGGRLFMIGGVMILLTFFLPANYEMYIIFSVVAMVSVIPMAYSYLLVRKIDNQG